MALCLSPPPGPRATAPWSPGGLTLSALSALRPSRGGFRRLPDLRRGGHRRQCRCAGRICWPESGAPGVGGRRADRPGAPAGGRGSSRRGAVHGRTAPPGPCGPGWRPSRRWRSPSGRSGPLLAGARRAVAQRRHVGRGGRRGDLGRAPAAGGRGPALEPSSAVGVAVARTEARTSGALVVAIGTATGLKGRRADTAARSGGRPRGGRKVPARPVRLSASRGR